MPLQSLEELASLRAQILERRRFAADVERARQVAAQMPGTIQSVTVRCEKSSHSHRRDSPKLADAIPVLGGILVVSTIKVRASDQLNLPPWDVESYLGAGLDGASLEGVLNDDQQLSDWLNHVDRWARGESVRPDGDHGERWLMSSPPRRLTTMLLPNGPSPIRAWIRCPRQGDHEELTYAQLAEALR